MAELRSRVLALKDTGVLMETAFADGAVYSLVVLGDGTVSLYFSTGGGVIGAGQHDRVRRAADAMLSEASRFRPEAKPAGETPLPGPGNVVFYFLSAGGTLAYSAAESALGGDQDRLSALFHAGHRVITEIRKIEQSAKS
jgi:hypothetical protein